MKRRLVLDLDEEWERSGRVLLCFHFLHSSVLLTRGLSLQVGMFRLHGCLFLTGSCAEPFAGLFFVGLFFVGPFSHSGL